MPSKTELLEQVEKLQKEIEQYKQSINRRDSDEQILKVNIKHYQETIASYTDKADRQKEEIDKLRTEYKDAKDEVNKCKAELAKLSDVSTVIDEIKSAMAYPAQALNERIAELECQLQDEKNALKSCEDIYAENTRLQLENHFLDGKVRAYELCMRVKHDCSDEF